MNVFTNTDRITELSDLISATSDPAAKSYMQAEIDGLMEVQIQLAGVGRPIQKGAPNETYEES